MYKITYQRDEIVDSNYVNNEIKKHPNEEVLLEIQNTVSISKDILEKLDKNLKIRVIGPNTDKRLIQHTGGKTDFYFSNGESAQEYFVNSQIYSNNELRAILNSIETIESKINPKWDELTKVVFIYDYIKSHIIYDPKYKSKKSKSREIRSLRGLISKKSVCAGYAEIFKEILDRQKIKCRYVTGYSHGDPHSGHAWNIIKIDGKKYPIDLTWDSNQYRCGMMNKFDFLGVNLKEFAKNHTPNNYEPDQDYEHTLSEFDSKEIEKRYQIIKNSNDYKLTSWQPIRSDGTRFYLAAVGNARAGQSNVYRYYYRDINADGSLGEPQLFYSTTNILFYVDRFQWNDENYKNSDIYDAIKNILFSKQNIKDSKDNQTNYLGRIEKSKNGNKIITASSIEELSKKNAPKNLFNRPQKIVERKDKSKIIIEFTGESNGIYHYHIFDLDTKENVLKRNIIKTTFDLFNNLTPDIIETYLNKDYLDKCAKEKGGYISYNPANQLTNPEFNTSKKRIPTFEELHNIAINYNLIYDNNLNIIGCEDLKGNKVTDEELKENILFAEIWLGAAGVKYMQNDKKNGESYAFNNQAKFLYSRICSMCEEDIKKSGIINPGRMLEEIYQHNYYKYDDEIIRKLFLTPYQTNLLNEYFGKRTDTKVFATQLPESISSYLASKQTQKAI